MVRSCVRCPSRPSQEWFGAVRFQDGGGTSGGTSSSKSPASSISMSWRVSPGSTGVSETLEGSSEDGADAEEEFSTLEGSVSDEEVTATGLRTGDMARWSGGVFFSKVENVSDPGVKKKTDSVNSALAELRNQM